MDPPSWSPQSSREGSSVTCPRSTWSSPRALEGVREGFPEVVGPVLSTEEGKKLPERVVMSKGAGTRNCKKILGGAREKRRDSSLQPVQSFLEKNSQADTGERSR